MVTLYHVINYVIIKLLYNNGIKMVTLSTIINYTIFIPLLYHQWDV